MNIEAVIKILDCVFHHDCDGNFDQNILKKNLLTVRFLCQDSSEDKLCEENKQRVDEFERLIQGIADYCHDNGIRYYLPKAYQHYPDMGHDVDLFIDAKGDRLKDFIHHFQLTKDKTKIGWQANTLICSIKPSPWKHIGLLAILESLNS